MLSCKNLSFTIGNKIILDNISIQIEQGEVVVLIGSNGSGKTTLMRNLAKLEKPNCGRITLDNQGPNSTQPNSNFHPKVTIVMQDPNLYPHLNVRDNILLATNKQSNFDELTQYFGIQKLLSKFPKELSGGQKQLVAFVRAIILEPKYLLLDEVTSALDSFNTNLVQNYLQKLKSQGIGIILISHSINFTKKIADKIYFIHSGKILESGGIEILDNPKTEELIDFLDQN